MLRCPWLRCGFAPTSNIDLAQHLFDNPDTVEHRVTGENEPAPPAPRRQRVIYSHQTPDPADIEIGVRVMRYAENVKPGWVKVEMPCCPRDLFAKIPARAVLLPTAYDTDITHAACPSCAWLWAAQVEDQGGEDYLADLVLVEKVAMASPRRTYAAL